MGVPPRARIGLAVAQVAGAVVALVLGNSALALLLLAGAALLAISTRLARADKQSPDYIRRSVWVFGAVGLGFLVVGVLQLVDVLHPRRDESTPLLVLAGLMFLDLARRINRARSGPRVEDT
jgi:hypothetical protein